MTTTRPILALLFVLATSAALAEECDRVAADMADFDRVVAAKKSSFELIPSDPHADRDRQFQREVLTILEELYPSGEASPQNYAFLYDRVSYGDSQPQRYATQGKCEGPNNWQPFPTEDLSNVDVRRALMGLEPLAERKKQLDQNCY